MNWKTISLVLVSCALMVAASFRALYTGSPDAPTAGLVRHTAVVDAETITAQKAAIIAAAGQNAVAYINAARGELQGDNPAGAKRFMAQASAILTQIRNSLHRDQDGRGPGGKLRVPLWAQVRLADEQASPTLQSRLKAATNHAIQGRHDKVVEYLGSLGVNAVYSYIDMPLDATLDRLNGAREAMEQGDEIEALALLDAANDGLVSQTLEVGTGGGSQTTAPDDA